eukprot:TRINITY_DN10282_c0_g1_i1.p1 TRINITY_DN10282_c0_g1~~TRINITY_DN10282_c0_g1_i1.p1  ORF type:complete len:453 (+),score=64.98 TRINITY_DN10282_c0_g1_i1:509-1867(+)
MPIAPWNIQNHDPWKSEKLKFIPFHSWFRERRYRNNQFLLEEESYVKKSSNSKFEKLQNLSVFCSSQSYRHVDYIEFENPQIIDNFLAHWRSTGNQRVGFLIGKYEIDKRIPLGIRAVVTAIYEPPQSVHPKDPFKVIGWDKDPDEAHVDKLAAKLGLQRVGFIWTSILVNEAKKILPNRDENHPLKAGECETMAKLQNKYPNPWAKSLSGKFGSKFVSVLISGTKEGNIELQGYQMSNQCCWLVKDEAIKPSLKEESSFRARKSTPDTLYPDILYTDKNEYGFDVQFKADPTFPVLFFILSLGHGFPKKVQPTFKSQNFPIENRDKSSQSLNRVASTLQNRHGEDFFNALSDFHLLLYLSKQTDPAIQAIFDPLLKGVINPKSLPNANEVIQPLQTLLGKFKAPVQSSSSKRESMIQSLVQMGYSYAQANEALFATGDTSIEAAIDYILRS